MSERIVIDPITRIEGHLRVEAEIEGGTIKNAYSSGTMVQMCIRDRYLSFYFINISFLFNNNRLHPKFLPFKDFN